MVKRFAVAAVIVAAACVGKPETETQAVQRAAIEYLAAQRGETAACVHVATQPGPDADGFLGTNLQDPPGGFMQRLRANGVDARPFSTCKEGPIVAVAWPAISGDVATVSAAWVCGSQCELDYQVTVVKGTSGWRAEAARFKRGS